MDTCECDHGFENKDSSNPHERNGEHGFLKSVRCETRVMLNLREENGDQSSGRSTSSSEMFEDATDRQSSEKSMPYLTDDSLFISSDLYEFFQSSLPNIVKGCQWVLLYRAVL